MLFSVIGLYSYGCQGSGVGLPYRVFCAALQNKCSLFQSGSWKSRTSILADPGLGEGHLPSLQMTIFLLTHHGWGQRARAQHTDQANKFLGPYKNIEPLWGLTRVTWLPPKIPSPNPKQEGHGVRWCKHVFHSTVSENKAQLGSWSRQRTERYPSWTRSQSCSKGRCS